MPSKEYPIPSGSNYIVSFYTSTDHKIVEVYYPFYKNLTQVKRRATELANKLTSKVETISIVSGKTGNELSFKLFNTWYDE